MRILLVAILSLSALCANAQINRGTILVGGFVDVTRVRGFDDIVDVDRGDGLTMNLKGGYFVSKNLAFGLDYQRRSRTGGDVEVYGRYYHKGKLIGGLGYFIKENTTTIEGGYAFFLAPFVAIEPTMTYRHSTENLGLNVNVSFFLNRVQKND